MDVMSLKFDFYYIINIFSFVLQGDDTCDLFIYDEDIGQTKDVYDVGNEDESKMNDFEVVDLLKELYGVSKKKNKKLQKKLNSKTFI